MKRTLSILSAVLLILSIGACKKKEEKPVPMAPAAPGIQQPGMQPPPPGHPVTKTETKVVVPESVKGKWSAVKIVLEDKTSKKTQEFTVTLNSEFKVPNTNLKLVVGDFLPDFRMDAGTITSASNELNNPAVSVKVFEGDKEIFKGWLYSKFPTIHPFEHPKYGLTLKEGIKKG
jgi:hypothetical protein